MLGYAREAHALAGGRTRDDLSSDRQFNLAMARLLELIGEAANRVPPEQRLRYPEIPWAQMIGLRNRLIHGYDQIDLDILWTILARDLPALISVLDGLLPPGDG